MLVTRLFFFFFNDTATTEIYTLSLHDALPIYRGRRLGLERAGRDVVEERERPRAVDEDVVHAVVHEVLAHCVVDAGARGDQHLGADAVGGEHEDRPLVARRQPDHPTERAQRAQRELRARLPDELRDAALRLVGRVEMDARRGVAIGHARFASSMSKCTRSLKARTRARTSASVTSASPSTPKASTANEPSAAPYTMARRRLASETAPVDARDPMNPPAKA